MKKKIAILGAALFQEPAIVKAKEMVTSKIIKKIIKKQKTIIHSVKMIIKWIK